MLHQSNNNRNGDRSWRDEIIQRTREAIQRSNDMAIQQLSNGITLDELSETIVKNGVPSVPIPIKEEVCIKIRKSCYDDRRQHHQR